MKVCLDIGGTNTRVAQFVKSGKGDWQLNTFDQWPTQQYFQDAWMQIAEKCKGWTQQADEICIGAAGTLDSRKRQLLHAPNLPGWVGLDMVLAAEKALGAPTRIENDAALGALGEARFGAGVGYKSVGYVAVGTGIGGAVVVEGKLGLNLKGFEPGQMVVDMVDGEPVAWESLAGGKGLEKRYGVKPEQITDSKVWQEEEKWLAVGLRNCATDWACEVIVVGGSIGLRMYSESLVEAYGKLTAGIYTDPPKLAAAKLANKSVVWGAAAF